MLLSWREHNFSFDQGIDRGGGEPVRGEGEYTLTGLSYRNSNKANPK